MILTEAQIRSSNDYDVLSQDYWQPIPATTPDECHRVRLMAERMAELRPREVCAYIPIAAPLQPAPPPSPQPRKPCSPKPHNKASKPASVAAFKDLFR